MKYLLMILLLVCVSCKDSTKKDCKQNYAYGIILSSSMQQILYDYIKENPNFENIMLDNETYNSICKKNIKKAGIEYYLLGPTYIGEHFDEDLNDILCPAICLKFCGKNIFIKSSVDKLTNQRAMHHKYMEHQEFKGIKNDIDKYYWLVRIDNTTKAYIVTKDIKEFGVPISNEIQEFKAPVINITNR